VVMGKADLARECDRLAEMHRTVAHVISYTHFKTFTFNANFERSYDQPAPAHYISHHTTRVLCQSRILHEDRPGGDATDLEIPRARPMLDHGALLLSS
jgi:hypothetical protein